MASNWISSCLILWVLGRQALATWPCSASLYTPLPWLSEERCSLPLGTCVSQGTGVERDPHTHKSGERTTAKPHRVGLE